MRSCWKAPASVLLAGLTLAVAERPASAAYPGDDGRIAFLSTDERATHVFTVEQDGSGLVVAYSCDKSVPTVCNFPFQRSVAFSPDGTRLALVPGAALAVVATDGSDFRLLPQGSGFDRSPAWSPSGDRLAFVRTYGAAGDVYTVRVDGGGLRRLTRGAQAVEVAWSTRGELAYSTTRYRQRGRVVRMDANGRHRRVLVERGQPTALDWSPTGAHLSFTRVGRRAGVWRVDRKGRRAVPQAPGVYDAVLAPSGRRLVHEVQRGFAIARLDGSMPRFLEPQIPTYFSAPYLQSWQPLPR